MLLFREAVKTDPKRVEVLEKIVSDGNLSYNDLTMAKFMSDFEKDGIESAIEELRGMEDVGLFRDGTYAKSIKLWADWKKELSKKGGYGIDEDEGPIIEPEIECESCGWKGSEDDLETIETEYREYPDAQKQIDFSYQCPGCGSDEILEIPKRASVSKDIKAMIDRDSPVYCDKCGWYGFEEELDKDEGDEVICPDCESTEVAYLDDVEQFEKERNISPEDSILKTDSVEAMIDRAIKAALKKESTKEYEEWSLTFDNIPEYHHVDFSKFDTDELKSSAESYIEYNDFEDPTSKKYYKEIVKELNKRGIPTKDITEN